MMLPGVTWSHGGVWFPYVSGVARHPQPPWIAPRLVTAGILVYTEQRIVLLRI